MARSAPQLYRPSPGWRPGGSEPALELISGDRRCVLRCYPSGDKLFEAEAERILAELQASSGGWKKLLEQFQSRMIESYPNIRIQPRDILASHGSPTELWYCYRDGGLLANVPSQP